MIAGLTALALLTACGSAPDHATDQAAIEAALRQWPIDFNAERTDAVCGLFADDAVLAYPDGADRNRAEFCARMQKLFDDPEKTFSYEAPAIRRVLVDGDLATVQLDWKLTVRNASGKVLDTTDEDGLDVFGRQADGSWKILVSHAFTKE